MSDTIHISQCPVCGNKNNDLFLESKDYFASQQKFSIEKCPACEFRFTQDFPSEETISTYYESQDYISHSDSKKGFINSLYHKARAYMLNSKARFVEKQSDKKGSLLDIGAGTGYFGNEMKQRGWNVALIEKSDSARSFIKEKWNLNVEDHQSLFSLLPDSFDVITLWHVLEHLQSLNETMNKLHTILKENGTLLIALPNADSYDAKKYGKYWAAYDLPRHLWHFNANSLALLAANHGFEVRKLKRMPLDVFYISLLSEKYRGRSMGMIRAICNGKFGWIAALFNIRKTSSLIYVLKKKPLTTNH